MEGLRKQCLDLSLALGLTGLPSLLMTTPGLLLFVGVDDIAKIPPVTLVGGAASLLRTTIAGDFAGSSRIPLIAAVLATILLRQHLEVVAHELDHADRPFHPTCFEVELVLLDGPGEDLRRTRQSRNVTHDHPHRKIQVRTKRFDALSIAKCLPPQTLQPLVVQLLLALDDLALRRRPDQVVEVIDHPTPPCRLARLQECELAHPWAVMRRTPARRLRQRPETSKEAIEAVAALPDGLGDADVLVGGDLKVDGPFQPSLLWSQEAWKTAWAAAYVVGDQLALWVQRILERATSRSQPPAFFVRKSAT